LTTPDNLLFLHLLKDDLSPLTVKTGWRPKFELDGF